MAYEVTATRKRPRSFEHMVGQEFVVASLSNSLKTGRIAHAYLFSGPRGVGKTSAARILARALNCPKGLTAESCEDYPGSEEISRGTSMDVIEIDGASNTSVNDIRTIKDEVLFPPQGSRYKIYIIDEVHMLSNSAFNALLKTIEEPPPYIIFIFATTEIHKVPATIRSRCQQFNFRLIPQEEIVRLLGEACEELKVEPEQEALSWIAKEATGSLRDAYTLFDQIVSFSEKAITVEKIREKLGVLGLERINEFAELIIEGNAGLALDAFDTLLSGGISLEQFIEDLGEYFRSLLLLKHGIRRENLLGYSPDRFSHRVQDNLQDFQLERLIELLLQVYRNIRYSMNPRYDVEVWISKACAIHRFLPVGEVVKQIHQLQGQEDVSKKRISTEPVNPAAGTKGETKASPIAQLQNPGESEGEGLKAGFVRQIADKTKNQFKNPSQPSPLKRGPDTGIPPESIGTTGTTGPTGTAGTTDVPQGGQISEKNGTKPSVDPKPALVSETKDVPTHSHQELNQDRGEVNRSVANEPDITPESRTDTSPDIITQSHIADVLAALRKFNITLATFLEKATQWRLEKNNLVIHFPTAMSAKMISENGKVLSGVIEQVLMPGLEILIVVDKTGGDETGESGEDDPQVQMAKDIFRGTVVEE